MDSTFLDGQYSLIVNRIAYSLNECLQFCCHLSDTIRGSGFRDRFWLVSPLDRGTALALDVTFEERPHAFHFLGVISV